MYTPAHFVETRTEILHDFIRQHPLGAVVTHTAEAGLIASHLPMFLDEHNGVLRCHLAKANPQWQILASATEVLVIFGGAEHYITPSWYPSKADDGKVVPTWNYTAVHVTGRPRILNADELMQLLHDLTDESEKSLPIQWSVNDAPADYIHGLTKAIVGVEIAIDRLEAKWKHSQNRPAADRDGVIAGLDSLGTHRAAQMSAAMKK